jgi:6-phosphogluconolactonase
MAQPEIKVLPDPASVAREAADRIVAAAKAAIAAKGRFSIALAGGSTPKASFQLLASDAYRSKVDWPKVDIYFGDERCVAPDHKDSNYLMAKESLLSKAPIAAENVYRMRGEIDPEQAAKEYGLLLKQKLGDGGIDLVMLGMGDDGHTLSLFPGTKAVTEREHRVVANYAENSTTGKSWRITMTAPFVNKAAAVLICVTGAGKAGRIRDVLKGPSEPERMPIQLIQPSPGKLIWLLDAPAAAALEK